MTQQLDGRNIEDMEPLELKDQLEKVHLTQVSSAAYACRNFVLDGSLLLQVTGCCLQALQRNTELKSELHHEEQRRQKAVGVLLGVTKL